MAEIFEQDILESLKTLHSGGVLLYPTDTIWGLGCDATNASAVEKIFKIKKRPDAKSLIILVADERMILDHVAAPDLGVFDFLKKQTKPTTVIFKNALGLPDNLVACDSSIAIRLVTDDFCRHLIKRFRKPIVSTSANISGELSPTSFLTVSDQIKEAVDYKVQWRQKEQTAAQPSRIIRWKGDGQYEIIRP